MVRQVAGLVWDAMRGEMVRTAANHPVNGSNVDSLQRAVGQGASRQGKINPIFLQMQNPVGQHQPNIDVEELQQAFGDHRNAVQAAKSNRRGDDQFAACSGILACGNPLDFRQIGEGAFARVRTGLAGLGQNNPAVPADQQPCAQMGFKIGNPQLQTGRLD